MGTFETGEIASTTLKKMEVPTFEEIFKQIKINFALSSMPFDEQKFSWKFFLPYLALTFVVSEECAFFVSKVSAENMLQLTELAPCIAMGLLSLIKILWVFFKKNKVFRLAHNLEKLYNDIRGDPVKLNVIQKEVLVLKTLTKYYFILNAILISIYNFSTLFLMSYQYLTDKPITFSLPYSVIVPFTVDSWTSWFFAYIHLIICGKFNFI